MSIHLSHTHAFVGVLNSSLLASFAVDDSDAETAPVVTVVDASCMCACACVCKRAI